MVWCSQKYDLYCVVLIPKQMVVVRSVGPSNENVPRLHLWMVERDRILSVDFLTKFKWLGNFSVDRMFSVKCFDFFVYKHRFSWILHPRAGGEHFTSKLRACPKCQILPQIG